jgi:hypothetical protein
MSFGSTGYHQIKFRIIDQNDQIWPPVDQAGRDFPEGLKNSKKPFPTGQTNYGHFFSMTEESHARFFHV